MDIHPPVRANTNTDLSVASKRFFNNKLPDNQDIISIRNNILRQQQQKPFVKKFVNYAGYPLWDKAVIKTGIENTTSENGNRETVEGKVIFIPIAKDSIIKAILRVKIQNHDTAFKMIYRWQYKEHGYGKNKKFNNANQVALLFMGMESYAFGHHYFKINDTLLFREKDSTVKGIHLTSFNKSATNLRMELMTVTICYQKTIDAYDADCPPMGGGEIPTETVCDNYNEWVEVSGSSDVGSGESPEPPAGTSGGAPDDGGGWEEDPCAPSANRTFSAMKLAPCDGGGEEEDPWVPLPDPPPLPDDYVPPFDPNNPFANLGNPVDVPDDPIILSSVLITDDITTNDPIGIPRIIAHTQNRNNTEDMLSETNGDATGILPSELQKSDIDLFNDMSSLFYWCTYFDNDLRNVGNVMIQKFKDKTGGTFENPTLNQKVASSSVLHNFVIKFASILEDALKDAGGDIDNVTEIKLREYRPKFNGYYNEFHGLQILINDTEYTEIQLDGFRIGSDGKRTAIITLTIHDHFGLDKADALKYQNEPVGGSGFAAWWILQHRKAYKPFETIIQVRKKLEWKP